MARLSKGDFTPDMTPMIDMVFQLMIFFLVTIKMDQDMINKEIELSSAPHGPAIEERDPRTIIIEVDRRGRVSVGNVRMSPDYLRGILRTAVNRSGYGIPVLVRGDQKTQHADIKTVMDICSSVGLWRIRFAAIKAKAKGTS